MAHAKNRYHGKQIGWDKEDYNAKHFFGCWVCKRGYVKQNGSAYTQARKWVKDRCNRDLRRKKDEEIPMASKRGYRRLVNYLYRWE